MIIKIFNNFLSLFLLTISFSSCAQHLGHTKEELKTRYENDIEHWNEFEKTANAKENSKEKALNLISYGRWMRYQRNKESDSMEEVLKRMKEEYEDGLTSRNFGYNMITFSIDGGYHDTASDYGQSETKGSFKIDGQGKKISIDYTYVSKLNKNKGKKFQKSYAIIYVDGNFLVLAEKGKKIYFHRQ